MTSLMRFGCMRVSKSNKIVLCLKRHTGVICKCDMLMNVCSFGWKCWVYTHNSMDLWHLNNACTCLCVCEWVRRCCKKWRTSCWLGQLQVQEANGDLSILMFLFFNFNFYVCMKNTSTVWPTLFSGQTLVKHVPPLPFPPTPCLPINGQPFDCQGISQVVVQLTLTYPLCGFGVHLLSFWCQLKWIHED